MAVETVLARREMTPTERANAQLVIDHFKSWTLPEQEFYREFDTVFAPDARVRWESNALSPVQWDLAQWRVGTQRLKDGAKKYYEAGMTATPTLHEVFACGPLVVATRTDVVTETGKPDRPIPALSVFVIRDGKIVEWSDFFDAEAEKADAQLVLDHFTAWENNFDPAARYTRAFAPDARIRWESVAESPVQWDMANWRIGVAQIVEGSKKYIDAGMTVKSTVHEVFASGPMVVTHRTDVVDEPGKAQRIIKAVGVFLVKDGKIVEWSDFFG